MLFPVYCICPNAVHTLPPGPKRSLWPALNKKTQTGVSRSGSRGVVLWVTSLERFEDGGLGLQPDAPQLFSKPAVVLSDGPVRERLGERLPHTNTTAGNPGGRGGSGDETVQIRLVYVANGQGDTLFTVSRPQDVGTFGVIEEPLRGVFLDCH